MSLHMSRQGEKLIKVRQLERSAAASSCNILYIANSERHKLESILKKLGDKPVLTVSSVANFAKQGGIIGFVNIQNKVRLQINRKSAQQANIKISAKLLEVASLIFNGVSKERQL